MFLVKFSIMTILVYCLKKGGLITVTQVVLVGDYLRENILFLSEFVLKRRQHLLQFGYAWINEVNFTDKPLQVNDLSRPVHSQQPFKWDIIRLQVFSFWKTEISVYIIRHAAVSHTHTLSLFLWDTQTKCMLTLLFSNCITLHTNQMHANSLILKLHSYQNKLFTFRPKDVPVTGHWLTCHVDMLTKTCMHTACKWCLNAMESNAKTFNEETKTTPQPEETGESFKRE